MTPAPKDAPVEPDFVLVPREPTEAMARAYFEASAKAAREDFGIDPGTWERLSDSQRERLRQFGRAMVAAGRQAAPPAPNDSPVEPDFDQWALELDGDYTESMLEDVAGLLRAAWQAAPQPEGGLSAAIKHGEMQIGIDGELEVAERRIAELEATLREAETILDDMIPYAQATIGLPRPSWSYDNVILRAERWKIDLTTAGAGKGEE